MNTRLSREFYQQPTVECARQLLGKQLVFGKHRGFITETEAYVGKDDPACHAARGKTKRTEVMFGPPGFSYVYLIYGMYHCLNVVTEAEGFPAAVLIRGVELEGEPPLHLDGPGKLCRDMGITREHNQLDMVKSDEFTIYDSNVTFAYNTTPRIGISQGQDKLWRFVRT